MLNERQIEKKLFEQAEMFRHHMRRKDYLSAALCVDWAADVALFIGLDEDSKTELFGSREDPDNPIEGLIREEEYMKACHWCIFKGGYEHSRHTYQNIRKLV